MKDKRLKRLLSKDKWLKQEINHQNKLKYKKLNQILCKR